MGRLPRSGDPIANRDSPAEPCQRQFMEIVPSTRSDRKGAVAASKQSYDGNYWRKKASLTHQEARFVDEEGQKRLARVAREYEKLAMQADLSHAEDDRRSG